MLRSIELKNYRGFKQYRLSKLSRVNLLVGRNNCGKTSLLEAVHLLASKGDPEVLAHTARQRGEVVFAHEDRERVRRRLPADVSHFFHGHQFGPGACFTVRSSDGLGEITVRVVSVGDLDREAARQLHLPFVEEDDVDLGATLAIQLEGSKYPFGPGVPAFPVTEQGAISLEAFYRYRGSPRPSDYDYARVQFITPDSLQPRSMSEMWNKVVMDGQESKVIEGMRILAPELTNIFFLSGERAYSSGDRSGILAAFAGTRRRLPLGSCGEGMRRLLALSLSVVGTEGGVLLVDEIDTGLHYSIMGDMWRLVVEAAKRANVQVFATTHSLDCVRGLASLCEDYPQLREEVSLQKIECELEQAVALDADQIILAVGQGMEVR